MFYRIGVPLLLVGILALIFLGLMIWYRRRQAEIEKEERLLAEQRWTGTCQFDNPNTGAKCTREEFHIDTHYRDVNGSLTFW